MKINIWIRRESIDDLSFFLSDRFEWSSDIDIPIWYSNPSSGGINGINDFLSVSLSYKEFKKLEDL